MTCKKELKKVSKMLKRSNEAAQLAGLVIHRLTRIHRTKTRAASTLLARRLQPKPLLTDQPIFFVQILAHKILNHHGVVRNISVAPI
jgi:hypothetical protein